MEEERRENKRRRLLVSSDLSHFCVWTAETRDAVRQLGYQILYFWEKESLCLIQYTHTDHGDVSSVTSQSADCGMGLAGSDNNGSNNISS